MTKELQEKLDADEAARDATNAAYAAAYAYHEAVDAAWAAYAAHWVVDAAWAAYHEAVAAAIKNYRKITLP